MTKDYREDPIPRPIGTVSTRDYGRVPVDLSCPEACEPLADAVKHGLAAESQYARSDGLNDPYRTRFASAPNSVFVRTSVIDKLIHVNGLLAPYGVELFLWDGYRRIATQRELWAFFMLEAGKQLGDVSHDEKVLFASTFASDPSRFNSSDPTTWPIHSTGGAIDLTLKRKNAPELLYMGGIYDDPSDVSFTCFYERKLQQAVSGSERMTASDAAALRNRRLLYHSMRAADFTNYASEWWHFDWGTQMWALLKNLEEPSLNQFALYGTTEL